MRGRIIEMKKCLCDNPRCGKCLAINCKDDYCKMHKVKNKIKYKSRILRNLKAIAKKYDQMVKRGHSKEKLCKLYDYRRLPRIKVDIENYAKEIKRLKELLK